MRPQLIQKSLLTKGEIMVTEEQCASDESIETPGKNEVNGAHPQQNKGKFKLFYILLIRSISREPSKTNDRIQLGP